MTVIVANLAEGTTAEDVKVGHRAIYLNVARDHSRTEPLFVGAQTAFSDFGVILSCSVRDLDNSSLEAQVVFSTKDDAERAVTRLK